MQSKHESILRAINNKNGYYNILTFPVHESFQSNWATLPHAFYLFRGKEIKNWDRRFAELPSNHILLDGKKTQIKLDMKFDIALSQNKWGNFPIAQRFAEQLGIPLISLEHTLPDPVWSEKQLNIPSSMRGDINVFISEYNAKKWKFDLKDSSVKIIHHGINIEKFCPSEKEKDNKILTVVNDYINRDRWCGWNIYRKVTEGLPINPVGDTPGFSTAAKNKEDLINKYQKASVFLNTSTVSPIPMSLLEAASCGCPIVTTATCMVPEIIEDGVNGFCSNDEEYLKDRLEWCLKNPKDAKKIGEQARETIIKKFNLIDHLKKWDNLFREVYGKGHL